MSDERYKKVMDQFGGGNNISSRLADKLENANPIDIKIRSRNRAVVSNVEENVEDDYTAEEQSEDIEEQKPNIIDEGREDDCGNEGSNNPNEENKPQKSPIKMSEPIHITQIIFAIATCVVMVLVIYFIVNVVVFLMNNVDPGVSQQFFNSSLENIFERY